MQAWIVGVLAMRELNTSLWEIAAKSKIEKCFEESRRAMIPDEAIQAEKVDRFAHAAVGKPVKLAIQADPRYPGWGPPGLTDGCFGGTDLGGCLGFEGPDLDATLDLGKPESIHALAAEFRQSVPVGVFLPTQVEFAVSDDGQAFHPVATVKPTVSLHEQGPLAQVFAAGNLDVKARYVRVHADSVGVIPDWHPAKGRKAWLFVDEIMVNPVKGE
jgi:hexosaminidase